MQKNGLRLFDLLDNLAGSAPNWAGSLSGYDAWKEGDKLFLCVDLPGVKKEDVNLQINEGLLTINAQRKENPKREYIAQGLQSRWQRRFELPEGYEDEADATLEDGVLTVSVSMKEALKPKQIEVK